MFQLFISLKAKHNKYLKDEEIKKEIAEQQKIMEKKIVKDFKGKYAVKYFELFFKLYFFILDISVIVFFYLSVTQTINILNEIVLLCVIFFFSRQEVSESNICFFIHFKFNIFFQVYIIF
jgi:hypothetical protein